jgi:hypothetical protein
MAVTLLKLPHRRERLQMFTQVYHGRVRLRVTEDLEFFMLVFRMLFTSSQHLHIVLTNSVAFRSQE